MSDECTCALPAAYVLPASHERWKWVPLLDEVAETLKLTDGAASPDIPTMFWEPALTGACALVDDVCTTTKHP